MAGACIPRNETIWDQKRRGHYEVYYLKWNHLESQTAVWLRYTLHIPSRKTERPTASLWGIFFDARDPKRNQALKETFPIEEWSATRDPFSFRVGDAVLTDSSASGRLEKGEKLLEWDLEWDPNPETVSYLPHPSLFKAPLPKTKVVTPNIDIRFRGTFRTQERTIPCRNEPGEQTHIWGTKHAERWVWGHCNAFKGDSDTVFWGLSAQIPIGRWVTPPMSIFYIRYRGEVYLLNQLWGAWRHPTDFSLGKWNFTAQVAEDLWFQGEFRTTPGRCVGVEYRDPDGDRLYCNNTKIANLQLKPLRKVRNRFIPEEPLYAEQTAAWELVERHSDPRVPVQI